MESATPGSPSWSCPPTPPILPTSRTPSPSRPPPRPSSCPSPEPNCAICLGKVKNASQTDFCSHKFCFNCLREWSKVKAECPLCKTAFKNIIHNVVSDYQYEEFRVPSPQRNLSGEGFFRGAGSWFLDDIIQFREQFTRSIASLSLPSLMPMPDHRFRMSAESRRPPRRRGLATSEFRADIYNRRLRVEPDSIVDAITGRARESTPGWYRDNPAQTHRLVPWLNRELNALLVTQPQRTMYVSQTIMEEILRSDIRSQAFHDRLHPYLGSRTKQFQHEFYHFAISVYDMIGYDRNAVYAEDREQPTPPDEGSSDDDDIIFVEEVRNPRPDSLEERDRRRPRDAPRPARPSRPARASPSPRPSPQLEGPSTSAATSTEEVISVDVDSPELISIASDNDHDSLPVCRPGPAPIRIKAAHSESEHDESEPACENSRRKSEKRRRRHRSPSSSSSDESDSERERKRKKYKGKGKGKGKNSSEARALKQRKKSKKRRRKREERDSDSAPPSRSSKKKKNISRARSNDSDSEPTEKRLEGASGRGRKVRLLDETLDHAFGQNGLTSADRSRPQEYDFKDPSDLRLTLLSRKMRSSDTKAFSYANDYGSGSSSDDEAKSRKIQSKIVKVQNLRG